MHREMGFQRFIKRFPDSESCLEEIKRLKYPNGIYCNACKRKTKHYKLNNRPVYECKICRKQISPLKNTLFEKSSTPLQVWFYALMIMTQARANVSITDLKNELNITYKTAWRMYRGILKLMEQNNSDLLIQGEVSKWVFFNKIELRVVRKKQN